VITPLAKTRVWDGLILGFDTEYESKGSKPVCFQLSDGGARSIIRPGKVTVSKLGQACIEDFGASPGDEVYLVSYFSIAELQFLPVKAESFAWREYGAGSFDCSFHDEDHGVTLHIFDLARFFEKQGLAAVAQSFGLEKKEWNRKKVTRADYRSAKFRDYAKHDAWLTARIMQELRGRFEPWSVDPIKEKTAASVASSVFRRAWVTEPVAAGNDRARWAGMKACWGGRAEAYARGEFPDVWELDLKSAYPRAAIDLGCMPVQGSWKEAKSLAALEKMKHGLCHVEFHWPDEEKYPSLPVILDEAQVYLLHGREWLTLEEVRAAREAGCEVKLLEGWGYSKGTAILRDFMETMLARREKVEGAEKVAVKLLANSLIGKFAQRVSDIDLEQLRKFAKKESMLLDDLGRMNRDELIALGLDPTVRVGSVFMPEWNALITGWTRARLGKLIRQHEAIYAATDAVWTTKEPGKLPSDLGVKRQGRGIVARAKFGAIFEANGEVHTAHHSVWNKQAALRCLGDLDGGPKKYATRRPIKLRESLRDGSRYGEWIQEFRVAEAHWDEKRKLHEDGSTSPHADVTAYRASVEAGRQARKGRRSRAEGDDSRNRGPTR